MQIPDPLIDVEIRKGYTVRLRRSQAIKLGYIVVDVKKVQAPVTKKVKATKNKSVGVSE